MNKSTERKSTERKFLVAIFGAIAYFVFNYWGIKIPDEVLYLLLGWIGVEGADDAIKIYANRPQRSVVNEIAPIIPQPSDSLNTLPKPQGFADKEKMTIPPINEAVQKFKEAWNLRGQYILTNITDPKQVEADYLEPFAKALQAANEMWRAIRGIEPPTDVDPCACGDLSYEARWLKFARSEMRIQQDMVNAIKANPHLGHLLGGLGYFLQGKPIDQIPEWVIQNLSEHIGQ